MIIGTAIEVGLLAGSVFLTLFCIVLARRLRRLNDLESGLGAAIAVMSSEIGRLDKSVRSAREEALSASDTLASQIAKARLERANWDLHLKMRDVLPVEDYPVRISSARLRKRKKHANA